MLLRLFDRDELQLIPSLEFAAPLPALEALRRSGGAERPRASSGSARTARRWCADLRARAAAWPPTTTCSIRACRTPCWPWCGSWSSGTGGTRRSPGWPCGFRPTATRNCPGRNGAWTTPRSPASRSDTGWRVPGEGPERFAARAAFLTGDAHRLAWLQWRADQCHRFYTRDVRTLLAAVRPDARLYLAGAEMFAGPEVEAPVAAHAAAAGHAGRRPARTPASIRGSTRRTTGLVLLRPERIVPSHAAVGPGRRPGNRPDARGRRVLPRPAAAGQPVLPSAAGRPRPLVRSARAPSSRASRGLLTQAGPVGAAEPAALRPQPGRHGFAGARRRRLAAAAGPGGRAARPGGGLPPAAADPLRRRWARTAASAQPVTFRSADLPGTDVCCTPSTTPRSRTTRAVDGRGLAVAARCAS